MNRERAKELWPIIKAYSEGKKIQYRSACRPTYPGEYEVIKVIEVLDDE